MQIYAIDASDHFSLPSPPPVLSTIDGDNDGDCVTMDDDDDGDNGGDDVTM